MDAQKQLAEALRSVLDAQMEVLAYLLDQEETPHVTGVLMGSLTKATQRHQSILRLRAAIEKLKNAELILESLRNG